MKAWAHLCIVASCVGLPLFVAASARQRGGVSDPNQALLRLGSRGARAHDPSTIVKCKNEYWFFCTGHGIPSYRSKDLVTWQPGPMIFREPRPWVKEAVPAHRTGMDFWAPDVIEVGGRYLLYYSASTFGKNTSAIAVATNATLDPDDPRYKWEDQGVVFRSAPPDNFNAIDPAVIHDGKRLWLTFGSFWSGIKLIELDPTTGKRISPDSKIYSLANNPQIEAPYIYKHGRNYYLFVNWGFCCRGINSTYEIRIGRSRSITGPYLDKEGKDLLASGGTLLLGSQAPMVGPGHAGIVREGHREWLSFHFYNAEENGMPTLGIRPITWDRDGWPTVGVN